MSRFKIHARLHVNGLTISNDEIETDDEQYAKFLVLSANFFKVAPTPADNPLGALGALLLGSPTGEAHVHLTDDENEDTGASTSLVLAAAITGEPVAAWQDRAAAFEAEFGKPFKGLHYDPDTSTLSLSLDTPDDMEAQERAESARVTAESEASVLEDDEAFAAFLDSLPGIDAKPGVDAKPKE